VTHLGTMEVELVETGADSTESQTKGLSVCEGVGAESVTRAELSGQRSYSQAK